MLAHEQYLRYYALQMFGNDLLITFIPLLNEHVWKIFSIASTISVKTLSLIQRKKEMGNLRFLILY